MCRYKLLDIFLKLWYKLNIYKLPLAVYADEFAGYGENLVGGCSVLGSIFL